MTPKDFGRRLGTGIRVAGRIAQQRAQQSSQPPASGSASTQAASAQPASYPAIPNMPAGKQARAALANSQNLTRAAGRGLGGLLRPFQKVGGALWLEVTGFFFGMFAVYFAQDIWRSRLGYATGPQHQRFLISVSLTLLFSYLCISAFWRAKRRT